MAYTQSQISLAEGREGFEFYKQLNKLIKNLLITEYSKLVTDTTECIVQTYFTFSGLHKENSSVQ